MLFDMSFSTVSKSLSSDAIRKEQLKYVRQHYRIFHNLAVLNVPCNLAY